MHVKGEGDTNSTMDKRDSLMMTSCTRRGKSKDLDLLKSEVT